ncbi:glycosyltransferase, partial [Candidatus Uhrbacteria bacterium]|nr:glycosyltransferase [Candidatus Uhrbacteria bacterium]
FMKLSVIIVNWNVRELLEKCLESLFLYAPRVPFEVCVVDNASHDQSVAMIQQKFPTVKVIANEKNEGFAVGCNQGVRATTGEYILFLNPDTLLTESSFAPLIHTLDVEPKAALAAPQLLSRNGSVQKSVRRFPTPLQATLEFFRLRRPKEYSYPEVMEVEQPMGAAMCVRRAVLEKIGTFDEKFFIWYEEVDLCRRIRDAGYRILYIPDSQIVHVGGESFAQHPTLRKQTFFYKSYATYLWKHLKWRGLLPFALMKMYVGVLTQPYFWLPLVIIASAEVLSLLGYFYPVAKTIGFVAVTALVFLLSLKSLAFGIMAVAAELVIGSKGHLFALELGGFTLSIRMALFLVVFGSWLLYLFKNHERFLFVRSFVFRWYLVLMGFVCWGVLIGVLNNNGLGALFKDANAWIFFLLAFPLFDAIRSHHALSHLWSVVTSALIAQLLKVGIVVYIMTHKSFGYEVLYPFYRWIRETGVGEITQFPWGALRVFFQSGLYPFLFIFIAIPLVLVLTRSNTTVAFFSGHWRMVVLLSGCIAAVLLSFSRSFWLAGACMIVALLVFLAVSGRWKELGRITLVGGASLSVALLAIAAITFIPIPSQTGGIGLDAFAKRFVDIDSEAAAASRWNLLPVLSHSIRENPLLGYGFGKAVTYISFDPRVREQNSAGTFTTYSFEWGWLDFVVKLGIGGLIAYVLLLAAIARQGYRLLKKKTETVLVSGLLLGLCALSLVHVFTPYLNHPLGIAVVLIASLVFTVLARKIPAV